VVLELLADFVFLYLPRGRLAGLAGTEDALRRGRPLGVVLDLRLPDGRGEQFLGRLKTDPAFADVPVIVVTVEAEPATALALGACVGAVLATRRTRRPTQLFLLGTTLVFAVLEIGAGSGRLTGNLVTRARSLIAVEPVGPLRSILDGRRR